MNKKAQMTDLIIGAVVVVILGVISLAIVDDLVSKNVEPQAVASETVTGSNTTSVLFANPDWSVNATCNCTAFSANLVLGNATWINDSCNAVDVTCSYSYFDPLYQNNATGRTITELLTIMFAVVVLSFIVVFLIFKK